MLAPLAGEGAFGFRDDAALLDVSGDGGLVVTTDTIVEGVHFLPDDPWLADKLIGVNRSDVLAKGAVPFAFTLSMCLPSNWTDARQRAFADDLARAARAAGLALLGGDTTRSPGPLMLGATMFGRPVEVDGAPRYVSRLGAKVGDVVALLGPVGDAAIATAHATGALSDEGIDLPALLRSASDPDALAKLEDARLRPDPSAATAPLVAGFASAAMDVSDGLLGDLAKLAAASGVAVEIDCDRVPLSSTVRHLLARADVGSDDTLRRIALTGGDDYVALVIIPPNRLDAATDAAADLALDGAFGIHPFGTVTGPAEAGAPLVRDVGRDLSRWGPLSYEH